MPSAPAKGQRGEARAAQSSRATSGKRSQLPAKVAEQRQGRPPKPVLFEDDEDDNFTPEERKLSDRIEKALDDENFPAALACVDAALSCTNTEIREAMVSTLGWFGVSGMPSLTRFLNDPDADVRESAMDEWSTALSEIEDDKERIEVTEMAMGVLSDEDALEDISGEYIGVDEKLAVESLARIIEAGRSECGVAKAKETYEFVTGEEWTDAKEAARWIAEEYKSAK